MKEKLKNSIPVKWMKSLKLIKSALLGMIMKSLWIFPINKRVVATSFYGQGYNGNPKYIVEELLGLESNIEIIWLVEEFDDSIPNQVKQVKYRGLRAIYYLATSSVWIDDCRKYSNVSKRKGQFYLQTWHGSIPLKKIERDAEEKLELEYISHAKNDSRMIDLVISDNTFGDKIFTESFWYNGKIIRTGMPKLDALFRSKSEAKSFIFKKLEVDQNIKFCLYTPTFRNGTNNSQLDLDFEEIIGKLETKFNNQFCILIRLHPNMKKNARMQFDNKKIIDVTEYTDVYELLLVSDVLITDYSSLMFEFPLVETKPVFLFAKDAVEYERGYYFNFKDLPFSFSSSQDELIEAFDNFDKNSYEKKLSLFYGNIDLLRNAESARYVAKYINNNVLKNLKKD